MYRLRAITLSFFVVLGVLALSVQFVSAETCAGGMIQAPQDLVDLNPDLAGKMHDTWEYRTA
jgi:hypothetical protein